jgi:translation initiation factor IF-1
MLKRNQRKMSKSDLIELTGAIEEVLPGNMFRVKVDNLPNILTCYTSGKLKQHKIKIILGDRVKIEVSPYDLTKGRVTYRL